MPQALVALLCVLIAQGPKSGATDVDLLRGWFEAVTAHKPGVTDEPLLAVARWPRADLQRLQVEVSILMMVIANPSLQRIRYVPPEAARFFDADPRKPQSIVFEGARLERIQATAQLMRAAGVDTTLKRGAVFHTDIITLRPDVGTIPDTPGRSAVVSVHVQDGRLAGVSHTPIHWDVARWLVTRIGASPNADLWVRDWYRASIAFRLGDREYSDDHVTAATKRFPSDALLLMLAGAQHEALASTGVQVFLRDRKDSTVTLPVESAERELAEAERLFDRAVSGDPDLVEARIRLARVIGLRGRHNDAIPHLRVAVRSASEPLMAYFADLFIGSELLAVGDTSGAREAYLRAAERFPNARSVNLSLADLAWRSGQRSEIEPRLHRALPPARGGAADDPWRVYYTSAGRNAGQMLDALRATIGSSSAGRF